MSGKGLGGGASRIRTADLWIMIRENPNRQNKTEQSSTDSMRVSRLASASCIFHFF
jgi:hypothetical protein